MSHRPATPIRLNQRHSAFFRSDHFFGLHARLWVLTFPFLAAIAWIGVITTALPPAIPSSTTVVARYHGSVEFNTVRTHRAKMRFRIDL
jgi:hypothetical protein